MHQSNFLNNTKMFDWQNLFCMMAYELKMLFGSKFSVKLMRLWLIRWVSVIVLHWIWQSNDLAHTKTFLKNILYPDHFPYTISYTISVPGRMKKLQNLPRIPVYRWFVLLTSMSITMKGTLTSMLRWKKYGREDWLSNNKWTLA